MIEKCTWNQKNQLVYRLYLALKLVFVCNTIKDKQTNKWKLYKTHRCEHWITHMCRQTENTFSQHSNKWVMRMKREQIATANDRKEIKWKVNTCSILKTRTYTYTYRCRSARLSVNEIKEFSIKINRRFYKTEEVNKKGTVETTTTSRFIVHEMKKISIFPHNCATSFNLQSVPPHFLTVFCEFEWK